ncbi:MAG: lyase [Leptospiraceae bacterium]|nr:lyase [Leptospiraceae bacterium]MCK6381310.1 lyase [Leptospiraceae bacterium]NUM40789.1 lyase [Leptospiraceae bacterium]
MKYRNSMAVLFIICFSLLELSAFSINVTDRSGRPLELAMVTVKLDRPHLASRDDKGYPYPEKEELISPEVTSFTDKNGNLNISYPYPDKILIRVRKIGYYDENFQGMSSNVSIQTKMEKITKPNDLVAQFPSNNWVAALDWGEEKEYRKVYMEQCGFCHQQGSYFMRRPYTEKDWETIMHRMIGYGSRPSSKVQKRLPKILSKAYKDLLDHPERVTEPRKWGSELYTTSIREWPIGDSFSQMHDLLYHSNGKVYVGDNLQDRIWEIDPRTGKTMVFKVPHIDDDGLGGLLSGRLKTFPKYETFVGIHSLAESSKDGHIFLTPSLQKRLIEFDPVTRKFTDHNFENGLYPHTIRIDKEDRVWFTLALSNQIGMFDRKTKTYRMYDLPSRSAKESFSLFVSGVILRLMNWGFPMHYLPVDDRVSGMPLPYGIDVSPNGMIWFARLHADSIGMIDPKTNKVEIIDTPFQSPRRLRADSENNLWIAAFSEAKVVKYTPSDKKFRDFPMPTAVDGIETPYSLNVDRPRNLVWVTGTSSDNLLTLDIKTEKWKVYPLPRRVSFTRDVEFSPQGIAYTCNGAFPSWHIEDTRPTLIEVNTKK